MGLFKKSKEKQLRQDIRKGLRKNESVSVSSDGVVTGGGGDKVKLSGRGRRKLAKEEAARITSGSPSGETTKITAKKNAKRNVKLSDDTRIETRGTDRARGSVTRTTPGSDTRETTTKLEQGKRESAGSVEVRGKQNKLGGAYSFGSSTLAGTIKNANQGISDVRERGNQGLTNKSKTGFFMRSTPFNKPGDAESRFSSTTATTQPGVITSNTSASSSTPGKIVEKKATTPEEIAAWKAAPQVNKDAYKPAVSFGGTSTSSTVSLEKVSPNVISSSTTGKLTPDATSTRNLTGGEVVTKPKKDRKKIREERRSERKINKQNKNVSRGKCPPCNC